MDNLFIIFPFWFPLSYIFLSINFPSSSKYLFIATLFLFAETHFASTWLFFFDRDNWRWLKSNLYKLVLLPLYVLSLTIFIWRFSPSMILVIHYLASGWHVTKQSAGLLKVYGVNPKIYSFIIYLISFSCLIIGLKEPGILSSNFDIADLNILLLLLLIIYIFILILNVSNKFNKQFRDLIPLITGILIYIPILFFKDLAIATVVGVGMHWCQYISIVWSSYFRKFNNNLSNQNNLSKNIKRLLFIFCYALLMSSLSVLGVPREINGTIEYSYLYLIPILFQLYHFYIDGFIWKFSDPHIRKNVLPYLYQPENIN